MINVVSRAGVLGSYLRASSGAIVSCGRPPAPLVPPTAPPPTMESFPQTSTSKALQDGTPSGTIRASSSITNKTQIRWSHTDVTKVPDFSAYRRPQSLKPNAKNDSAPIRHSYSYLVAGGAALATVYGTKSLVHFFVSTMAASKDVIAMSKIEINLKEIPEGKSVVFKWRGKPLFVRHRTDSEIAKERAVPVSELRDPQSDDERVKDPKWLIVIGVCTHLGCIPIANAGHYGGYYCPCHGSHYDSSGRIRMGPAPLNLEIPEYSFVGDSELIVG